MLFHSELSVDLVVRPPNVASFTAKKVQIKTTNKTGLLKNFIKNLNGVYGMKII